MVRFAFFWGILVTVMFKQVAVYAEMLMTPYLQAVTTNSIYVLVKSNSTADVKVDYGASTSYGKVAITKNYQTAEGGGVHVHNVKLTGLEPDTEYHYRVSQGGQYSKDYKFRTAPNPGKKFRFAWMADLHDLTTSISRAILTKVREAKPQILVLGGDLTGNPSLSEWEADFFTPQLCELIAEIPFFNAVGGHEAGENVEVFQQAPDECGSGTDFYYSFDYGDLHVLALYTPKGEDIEPGNAQYEFAKRDLENSTKPWKIVIFHRPVYSCGYYEGRRDLQEMAFHVWKPNGVVMTLNGHNHFFQHNIVNGIHHMIISPVGGVVRAPGGNCNFKEEGYRVEEYEIVKYKQTNSYAIADVTPTTFDLVVYDGNTGEVLDTVNLKKGPQPLSASIGTSTREGASPLTVHFTGSVSGGSGNYSYSWDFGDGNTSNVQNPVHTFVNTGDSAKTFTVTFTVRDTFASKVITHKVRVPTREGRK